MRPQHTHIHTHSLMWNVYNFVFGSYNKEEQKRWWPGAIDNRVRSSAESGRDKDVFGRRVREGKRRDGVGEAIEVLPSNCIPIYIRLEPIAVNYALGCHPSASRLCGVSLRSQKL
ncbi:Hypothetical protein CINCED_3A020732 [Cinara cedri]|uniref:Uncharacterized protein n=1 Tax=Cinara cedri TaxID=506608 RepID=A0A5E4M0W1_9HEMI|nr:Hypothetical protein CINCED_3A020732 [Cinara cedri]